MNLKLILIGGLVFFAVTWAISMVTGPLIHNGLLQADYQATAAFWRPELLQDPPDMMALLPLWTATGLVQAFIVAGVYGAVRSSFTGASWQRGMKYGFAVFLLYAGFMLMYSGIFNLPYKIWAYWIGESLVVYVVACGALGWVADMGWVSGKGSARAAA